MDVKQLKEIIQMFEKSKISELKIKDKNGNEYHLKKDGVPAPVAAKPQMVPAPAPAMAPEIVVPVRESASQPTANEEVDPGQVIKSPMVGTVYHTPSPDEAPFVTVGQNVKAGEVVCIVEAMKMMNEIKAEHDGTIKKICVNNAEAVEFGQIIIVFE